MARGLLGVRVPDGSVYLHVPSGRYLHVNESAAAIVGLLADGHSPSEAARHFAASVGISPEAGDADVRAVLESFEGLRRASSRPLRRHRVRGMGRLLLQWRRLPTRLRWPALRVAGLVCVVEVGLRTLDLRRLSSLVGAPLADTRAGTPSPPADLSRLSPVERRMLSAVEWLDGRWFTPMTCLRRALVTGFVLRRRGPVLRLGITGGGTTAHAWIEAEGVGYGTEDVAGVFASPD